MKLFMVIETESQERKSNPIWPFRAAVRTEDPTMAPAVQEALSTC